MTYTTTIRASKVTVHNTAGDPFQISLVGGDDVLCDGQDSTYLEIPTRGYYDDTTSYVDVQFTGAELPPNQLVTGISSIMWRMVTVDISTGSKYIYAYFANTNEPFSTIYYNTGDEYLLGPQSNRYYTTPQDVRTNVAYYYFPGEVMSPLALNDGGCHIYLSSYPMSNVPAGSKVRLLDLYFTVTSEDYNSVPRPVNDKIENAITLTGLSGSVNVDDTNVTPSALDPQEMYDYAQKGILWYKWVAPSDVGAKTMEFYTEADPSDPNALNGMTVLGVYTMGANGFMDRVWFSYEYAYTNYSEVFFKAAPGTTYYLAVASDSTTFGKWILKWQQSKVPPPNDDFENRVTLALNKDYSGTFEGATMQAGEPAGYNYDALFYGSVWFEHNTGTNSIIKLQIDTNIPVVAYVFSADNFYDMYNPVDGLHNYIDYQYYYQSSPPTNYEFVGKPNTTYYIQVLPNYAPVEGSAYTATALTPPPPPVKPPNDNFADRKVLSYYGPNGDMIIDLAGATREANEPAAGPSGDRTAWYEWTCPAELDGTTQIFTAEALESDTYYYFIIAVYTGTTLDNLKLLKQTRSMYMKASIDIAAEAGTTYIVQVVDPYTSSRYTKTLVGYPRMGSLKVHNGEGFVQLCNCGSNSALSEFVYGTDEHPWMMSRSNYIYSGSTPMTSHIFANCPVLGNGNGGRGGITGTAVNPVTGYYDDNVLSWTKADPLSSWVYLDTWITGTSEQYGTPGYSAWSFYMSGAEKPDNGGFIGDVVKIKIEALLETVGSDPVYIGFAQLAINGDSSYPGVALSSPGAPTWQSAEVLIASLSDPYFESTKIQPMFTNPSSAAGGVTPGNLTMWCSLNPTYPDQQHRIFQVKATIYYRDSSSTTGKLRLNAGTPDVPTWWTSSCCDDDNLPCHPLRVKVAEDDWQTAVSLVREPTEWVQPADIEYTLSAASAHGWTGAHYYKSANAPASISNYIDLSKGFRGGDIDISRASGGPQPDQDYSALQCAWDWSRRMWAGGGLWWWGPGGSYIWNGGPATCPTPSGTISNSAGGAGTVGYGQNYTPGTFGAGFGNDITQYAYTALQAINLSAIEFSQDVNGVTATTSSVPTPTGMTMEWESKRGTIQSLWVAADEPSQSTTALLPTVEWYAGTSLSLSEVETYGWGYSYTGANSGFFGSNAGPDAMLASQTHFTSYNGGLSPWWQVPDALIRSALSFETVHNLQFGGLALNCVPTKFLSDAVPSEFWPVNAKDTYVYRYNQFCAVRFVIRPPRYRFRYTSG